jgi:prevent-host-death family protein
MYAGECEMEKTINAVAMRQKLGQILDETYYRGDAFIIERAGRPMAAVVPVAQYEQWRQRRDEFFALIDEAQERTAKLPPEELEAAIAEAVAAVKMSERAAMEPAG